MTYEGLSEERYILDHLTPEEAEYALSLRPEQYYLWLSRLSERTGGPAQ